MLNLSSPADLIRIRRKATAALQVAREAIAGQHRTPTTGKPLTPPLGRVSVPCDPATNCGAAFVSEVVWPRDYSTVWPESIGPDVRTRTLPAPACVDAFEAAHMAARSPIVYPVEA